MDEGTISQKYSYCCEQSFKTKLELFLFKKTLDGNGTVAEFDEQDFLNYEIEDENIKKYAGVYWQQEYGDKVDDKVTVDDIYKAITEYKQGHQPKIMEVKKAMLMIARVRYMRVTLNPIVAVIALRFIQV